MSLANVREAFGSALRTIVVTGGTLHATPYLTDQISAPHAMFDFDVDYDMTMGRGGDEYRFTIQVFAPRQSPDASQAYLDVLRDPSNASSVKQVLEGSAVVAAQVDYCRVASASRPTVVTIAQADYLMSEFSVEVAI